MLKLLALAVAVASIPSFGTHVPKAYLSLTQ